MNFIDKMVTLLKLNLDEKESLNTETEQLKNELAEKNTKVTELQEVVKNNEGLHEFSVKDHMP